MSRDIEAYKSCYDKHLNLKVAAKELDIPWQTLYWHLSKVGHPVIGDKTKASSTDQLGCKGEDFIQSVIPHVENMNRLKHQASWDFNIGDYKIDVKSSTKKDGYKNSPNKNASFRWAFGFTELQRSSCDLIIALCYEGYDADSCGDVERILLIPKEFFSQKQGISVSCRASKWFDFEVSKDGLKEFFSVK